MKNHKVEFVGFNSFGVTLQNTAKRVNKYKHQVTNEAAKRLQKYIQQEIKRNELYKTGTLESINRGGIHKRKLAKGEYEVYMKPDYAVHLEYGTSRGIRPYKYFETAVDRFERRAYKEVAKQKFGYIIEREV